mmetsp:Transcript_127576/g.224842  ORF Transcript_127576/g.224842 Transcript_127576/m.224842 type:complete len:173 (-) Transcript_127576:139-657(-)
MAFFFSWICKPNCCCVGDEPQSGNSDFRPLSAVGMKTGDLALPEPTTQGMDESVPDTGHGEEAALPHKFVPTWAQTTDKLATELIVVVEKQNPYARIGLDIDHGDGTTLEICDVMDGLIQDYNNTVTTDLQVMPSDRIIQVNGISGDSRHMMHMVGTNSKVEMIIQKGGTCC